MVKDLLRCINETPVQARWMRSEISNRSQHYSLMLISRHNLTGFFGCASLTKYGSIVVCQDCLNSQQENVSFKSWGKMMMFPSLESAGNRVLIVEDDPASLIALVLAVQSESELELAAALRTADEAMNWRGAGSADILLIDPNLPSDAGIHSIGEYHKRHPLCNIVVLTDTSDAGSALACIEAGASGYLLKDADTFDVIVRRLKELRYGGAPISSVVARKVLERLRRQKTAGVAAAGETKDCQIKDGQAPALTSREKLVLGLMARGDTYAEVADILSITVRTVETHMKNIYKKLSVHSRGEAVFEAHVNGLLTSWK